MEGECHNWMKADVTGHFQVLRTSTVGRVEALWVKEGDRSCHKVGLRLVAAVSEKLVRVAVVDCQAGSVHMWDCGGKEQNMVTGWLDRTSIVEAAVHSG